MKYYTTLKKLQDHNACSNRYKHLVNHGKFTDRSRISLENILKINGIEDAIWALRTIDGIEKESRLFACDCAQSVLLIFEKKYKKDKRPGLAIQAARRYAKNPTEKNKQLMAAARYASVAAASDAASDAAWAAASDAARAAASDAARDAAVAAAWAAASDAASDAARYASVAAAVAAARYAARYASVAAAWAAASDAARDAAWDAARYAASDAARDAARKKQEELFIKYF